MTVPLDFATLESLIGYHVRADVACPQCGPDRHTLRNRKRHVLRLWRYEWQDRQGDLHRGISFKCARCDITGSVERDGEVEPVSEEERATMERRDAERRRRYDEERRPMQAFVARLWRESEDSKGTWAEAYLNGRGIQLPAEDYLRRRTLRFHPRCSFPKDDPLKRAPAPALLAAFEPIIPADPFLDPPVQAVSRIWGRGDGNKAMWGAVGGKAVKLTPHERVLSRLSICEGVETGLKLLERGMPIWALGSAVALEAFPVIERVRELTIYADHDRSGTGRDAARRCAGRWREAGKTIRIFMRPEEGQDYGEA
ncbi:DUF7146 domain-containing protein [Sinorhizobium chiapasense]|uniref:Toprim domain-containing protein n=1 Tax=Sinorhizobium chiapasense TaxID=501572 RepID=A0ABZ2B8K5_9HYPH